MARKYNHSQPEAYHRTEKYNDRSNSCVGGSDKKRKRKIM